MQGASRQCIFFRTGCVSSQNQPYDRIQTYERIGHCDIPIQSLSTKSLEHNMQVQSPNEMEPTLLPHKRKHTCNYFMKANC